MGDGGIDLRIWGKEKGLQRPYPLAWHLADTAAVAQRLWVRYLPLGVRRKIALSLGVEEDHARRLVAFWAGLHDLGKAVPGFQALCAAQYLRLCTDRRFSVSVSPEEMRHEVATHRVLAQMLADDGYGSGRSAAPAYRVAQMLGGHHGLFRTEDRRALAHPLLRFPGLGTDGWHEFRIGLFRAMREALGVPSPPPRVDGSAAALITGIVILADWLASQDGFLREQIGAFGDACHGVAAHFQSTYEHAGELLDAAGLRPIAMHRATFSETFSFNPNPLQQSIIDELPGHVSGPGLLLIAAATGDGKTEAGLCAARLLGEASDAPGLFFALPTMATADEMYKRVLRYVNRLAAGPTPVTLLHSMAWLREAFEADHGGVADGIVTSDPETMVAAPQWLSGAKRGLLAPVAVGTIDQALMGVVQLKHNVLRLLGLSGKVFLVDECHAYDPYMQGLLRRLLTWLGELRCPVVLMSATVPASIAQSLVAAYVAGTGHPAEPGRYAPDYPGWLYVSADTGEPTHVSDAARVEIATHRTARLTVEVRPVRHIPAGAGGDQRTERLSVLRSLLAPTITEAGCVAVVCNTVADAQTTYSTLRTWLDRGHSDAPMLHLLHSRFPARERARRTNDLIGRFGKDGIRPSQGGIVVATQVIEQSLDLDFDLIVSDLAPLAQLLQRAGRGHRHHRASRPRWVKDPRLIVLAPVIADGNLRRPPHWGTVYPEFLLASTHRTLNEWKDPFIDIPGDVSELMECAYNPPSPKPGESFTDDSALSEHWIDYEGDTLAQQSLAELVAIPPPAQIRELSQLSHDDLTDTYATTRLGADSRRALVVYLDDAGVPFLDTRHQRLLPTTGSGRSGRFTKKDIADLLSETIPIPENWVRDRAAEHIPPTPWHDNPWLRDLVLLPQGPDGTGTHIGGRMLRLDSDLGLIRE